MSKNPTYKIHFSGIGLIFVIFTINVLMIMVEDMLESNKWIVYFMLIIFSCVLVLSIVKTYKGKKLIFVAYDIIIINIIYIFIKILLDLPEFINEIFLLSICTYYFIGVNLMDDKTVPPKSRWYKPVIQYIFFPLSIIITIMLFM